MIKGGTRYIRHRARRGDLLGNLAIRYGTSVQAIKRVNHLHGNAIRAGRVYLIPKKARRHVRKAPAIHIPARRLPPSLPSRKPKA